RSLRTLHDVQPRLRSVRVGVLVAHGHERRRPASALVTKGPDQPPAPVPGRAVRKCRYVGGTIRHRDHQPSPRLRAFKLGHVFPDSLGLDDIGRQPGIVPDSATSIHPLYSNDFHFGGSRTDRLPGAGGMNRNPEIHGMLAMFETHEELLNAARRAYARGYRK